MRIVTFFLLSFSLFGCGTEGIEMDISQVDDWFLANEDSITSIMEKFKNDKCLRRVELGSMKYIKQNCKTSVAQNESINEIKNELAVLGVVLAVSHHFEDENFVSSILINRKGIAVSGGGLEINYWQHFPSHLHQKLECGAIVSLSRKNWYAEVLSSEDPCL